MRNKDKVAFIFIGDVHARVDKPQRRLDNPIDVVFSKLNYVFDRARKLSAGLVFGGDIGHRYYWDSRLLAAYLKLFQEYNDVPVLIVPGNHDLCGGSWLSFAETGLGLLTQLTTGTKVIVDRPSEARTFHDFQGTRVYCFPHASPCLQSFLAGTYEQVLKTEGVLNIAVAHAPVGGCRTPSQRDYRELYIPNFDIALFSDIHTGFPIDNILPNCTVANPGAIYRDDLADVSRKPSITLVYLSGKVTYEEVPHKPTSEVFDLSGTTTDEKEKKLEETEKSFSAALARTRFQKDSLSPIELIRSVAAAGKYTKEEVSLAEDAVNLI